MKELKGKKIIVIGAPGCVGMAVLIDIARCEAMGACIEYAESIEKAKELGADLMLAMPVRERVEVKDLGELLMGAAMSAAHSIDDLRDSINALEYDQKNQSYNNRYVQRYHRKSKW